jgi:7-cyano-7-deazaguanine synthase in queuosine biosynthesis
MTNHYLLWSGGYDSTSLLVKLGKEVVKIYRFML